MVGKKANVLYNNPMIPIVKVPNDVLTTPAKPVTFFDKRLTQMIREMHKTLITTTRPKGVGLAGPQVGYPYKIFVTKPTPSTPIRTFINPTILRSSEDTTDGVPERDNKLEGCLSIPNVWGKVARAKTLTVRYQDEKGNSHEEEFKGFLATIIQHETDHLNGILFTHRVLEQKGKFYQNATDKDGKEILEEIELT
jgi:peptide deformylase